VAGRKRRRGRGHQGGGGTRTVGRELGDFDDEPAEFHADHQEQGDAQIAPDQCHDDHYQGQQPEGGRAEHGAEHVP
jgi:hypothetical protein